MCGVGCAECLCLGSVGLLALVQDARIAELEAALAASEAANIAAEAARAAAEARARTADVRAWDVARELRRLRRQLCPTCRIAEA